MTPSRPSEHLTEAPLGDARPRLGDVLVARGAITREQLTVTLARSRTTGARLGHMLQTQGDISRLDLYHALAQMWNLPFIDLIADPPDEELLGRIGSETMLREHWVPHHIEADADGAPGAKRAVVATAEEPTAEFGEHVCEVLDVDSVQFAVTTDWDIDQAVLLGLPGRADRRGGLRTRGDAA